MGVQEYIKERGNPPEASLLYKRVHRTTGPRRVVERQVREEQDKLGPFISHQGSTLERGSGGKGSAPRKGVRQKASPGHAN